MAAVGKANLIDVVSLCVVLQEKSNLTESEACDYVVNRLSDWTIEVIYTIKDQTKMPVKVSIDEGKKILGNIFDSAWWIKAGKENDIINEINMSPRQVAVTIYTASNTFDIAREYLSYRSVITLPKNLPTTSNDFVSEQLAILNRAAVEFWSTADPDDKTTHPKKNAVIDWLEKQDFSKISAQQGAAIIRPKWGADGRR